MQCFAVVSCLYNAESGEAAPAIDHSLYAMVERGSECATEGDRGEKARAGVKDACHRFLSFFLSFLSLFVYFEYVDKTKTTHFANYTRFKVITSTLKYTPSGTITKCFVVLVKKKTIIHVGRR